MILLLSCATLATLAPAPVDGWVPMAPDVDDPRAGDTPCQAGAWAVACPSCTPPWSRPVVVACVGDGPPTWEEDMVAAIGGRSDEAMGEDWTIYRGSP